LQDDQYPLNRPIHSLVKVHEGLLTSHGSYFHIVYTVLTIQAFTEFNLFLISLYVQFGNIDVDDKGSEWEEMFCNSHNIPRSFSVSGAHYNRCTCGLRSTRVHYTDILL